MSNDLNIEETIKKVKDYYTAKIRSHIKRRERNLSLINFQHETPNNSHQIWYETRCNNKTIKIFYNKSKANEFVENWSKIDV